ncbi:hypothetical protein QYF36_024626 [Acer negundo]|nr:hypothetical protein QYF36_024626 [Acer negundo]
MLQLELSLITILFKSLFSRFPLWLYFIPGIELRTDSEPYKAEMQLFTAKIVDMMKQEKLMHLKVDLSFYHRTSQATQVGSPKRPAQGHKAL